MLTITKMKPLPDEVKLLIRSYASDRVAATPTALIMKKLRISYKEASNDNNIYNPARLVVEAEAPTRFSDNMTRHPLYERSYYLHDFLPSYWSLYADTFDNCYE